MTHAGVKTRNIRGSVLLVGCATRVPKNRGCVRAMFRSVIAAIAALWTVAVSAKEMDFRIADDGSTVPQSWIAADGEITRDTPDHFRKFVQKKGIDSTK